MIEVSSAVQQDKIIELLNAYDQDGFKFEFEDKKGIKLNFKVVSGDAEAAAKAAKAAIKAETWGSVLYIQVLAK